MQSLVKAYNSLRDSLRSVSLFISLKESLDKVLGLVVVLLKWLLR